MTVKKKSNMYSDSVKQWNVFIGCYYDCVYCEKSFKAQMKRQKQNCMQCYEYTPHFHESRLNDRLPRTHGDEFIWCCSSSDIKFARRWMIQKIIERIKEMPSRTFFFQSKDPSVFNDYAFPDNVILGTTIESNRFYTISSAPHPFIRYINFKDILHRRKIVTIEPILDFDVKEMVEWIKDILPERVYIGYDTKNCKLPEPPARNVRKLVNELTKITRVKTKYMKEEYIALDNNREELIRWNDNG